MRLVMSMRMVMLCSVCGGVMGSPDPDAFEAALCGAVAYKICPCCGRTVGDFKDRNYRQRARRWVAKQKKQRGDT